MRVLVVGSGGREHALAWKIARSPRVERVLAAPGSDGMAREATCFAAVKSEDAGALAALCRREAVDLVVIGPEAPLAAGVADRLREAGLAVFGPSAAAARLEGSKAFAKDFMARHRIPTAGYAVFEDLESARAHVRRHAGACVVKADGLAAGKGVAVCDGPEAALSALDEMMGERRFGEAGARVVIEERLHGEECSYYAVSDGERVVCLAAAQDHKRALDGDRGENTGGMGAYSPAPVLTEAVEKRVLEEIVHPTIRGMAAEGHPYTGVLYVGLMIDPAGAPKVVEFNVRFGDPETQPLVLRMEGDLVPLLEGAARGRVEAPRDLGWGDAAVCVVMASGGYPRGFTTGHRITGLEEAERDPDVVVFHAGTKRGPDGTFVTSGGRVLGVTARGESVAAARARAYAAVDRIRFDGAHARRDIAQRALSR
ncbi:MAG TPA: phosphoribosylamine--glycine ligase [Myxococcota bacterium]|jgi:phosphoribosylamine--glycine ligase|nr:phosphoribosylamine--glycine ligase [Myxococcota bacterium]